MADIFVLPLELQILIVDNIPRPGDLKSLCQTSQACWRLAAPRLHNEVIISVDRPDGAVALLKALRGPKKRKVGPFVKHLTFVDDREGIYNEYSEAYHQSTEFKDEPFTADLRASAILAAQVILDLLPRDGLRSFIFASWRAPSWLNPRFLFDRQKKLEKLSILGMTGGASNSVPNVKEATTNISDCDFNLSHGTSPGNGILTDAFLRNLPNLKHMSISACHGNERISEQTCLILNSLTESDLSKRPKPLPLVSLKLTNISVWDPDVTDALTACLDMDYLRSLVLADCVGVGTLFHVLAKRSTQSAANLTKLCVLEHPEMMSDENPGRCLHEFLSSFTGLEEICISLQYRTNAVAVREPHDLYCAQAPWFAVPKHGATLRKLYYNDRSGKVLEHRHCIRQYDAMSVLVQCSHLEQLAIPLGFGGFAAYPKDYQNFHDWLDGIHSGLDFCFQEPSNIRTLWLLNHIEVNLHEQQFYLKQREVVYTPSSVERFLTKCSTLVFQEHARRSINPFPKLRVLSFGASEAYWFIGEGRVAGQEIVRPMHFLRTERVDPLGRSVLEAYQASRQMVKYIEPCSDILDVDPWDLAHEYRGRPSFGFRSM